VKITNWNTGSQSIVYGACAARQWFASEFRWCVERDLHRYGRQLYIELRCCWLLLKRRLRWSPVLLETTWLIWVVGFSGEMYEGRKSIYREFDTQP
jgi:hypothetical protein